MMRHSSTLRGLILFAFLIAGLSSCGPAGDESVSAREAKTQEVSSNSNSNSNSLTEVCGPAKLVKDDEPVDWSRVPESFDQSGPFAIPPRPTWATDFAYCTDVMAALDTVPDGERNSVNGPNRFVYRTVDTEGGKGKPVIVNMMSLMLYPAAIHPAYDVEAREIGFFAPGVEFVTREKYPDAANVGADPTYRSSVDALIASCEERPKEGVSSADCTDHLAASLASGDARVGQLVNP